MADPSADYLTVGCDWCCGSLSPRSWRRGLDVICPACNAALPEADLRVDPFTDGTSHSTFRVTHLPSGAIVTEEVTTRIFFSRRAAMSRLARIVRGVENALEATHDGG